MVKTGGKQYAVRPGERLAVERLGLPEGAEVGLEPLMISDGGRVLLGEALAGAEVKARVVKHFRGEKIRVFVYRPKTGYKRTLGHRQPLSLLEVEEIVAPGLGGESAGKAGAAEGGREQEG